MDDKRSISLIVSGWTYTASFPRKRHDQEAIICSGRTRLAADDDDEIEKANLYLEIMRKKTDDQKSTYLIKDDGVDVVIYADRDDFSRIFQELKDHTRMGQCVMNIDFEGPIGQGRFHEFVDFQLNLSVDRGLA